MKIHKPKTIIEAINDLEVFLECDLYSKFRPQIKFPTKTGKWYRKDFFKNEKEFVNYLRGHFKILENQINMLTKNNKNE